MLIATPNTPKDVAGVALVPDNVTVSQLLKLCTPGKFLFIADESTGDNHTLSSFFDRKLDIEIGWPELGVDAPPKYLTPGSFRDFLVPDG
jgi:hypothetical protein